MQNITTILLPTVALAISLGIAYFAGKVLFDEAKDTHKRRITQVIVFLICVAIAVILVPKSRTKIEENRIVAVLAEMPFISAMEEIDPAVYRQYYRVLQNGVDQNMTKAQLKEQAMALTEKLMLERLPTAEDDAVIELTKAVMLSMHELRQQSGEKCYRFLFPETDKQPSDTVKHLSAAVQKQLQTAKGKVIVQQHDTALASDTLVRQHLSDVMLVLGKKYGADTAVALGNPRNSGVSKARLCNILYDFYAAILQKEHTVAATVIRSLSANATTEATDETGATTAIKTTAPE